MTMMRSAALAVLCCLITGFTMAKDLPDPYQWLEEVEGEKALSWVEERNRESLSVLENLPTFKPLFEKNLAVYNSDERIVYPSISGPYVYNFWRDEKNERGLWRRTTMADYQNDKPNWETVLDIDKLAKEEDENWVYKGASCLYPNYDRCMISLSRGGADASVRREFDVVKKRFVEDGFVLAEAKGGTGWIDKDHLFVATDFGEGTMTDSGYPRIVKIWQRGTPLSSAKTVHEGAQTDVGVWGFVLNTPEGSYPIVYQSETFYTRSIYLLRDGKTVKLDLPADSQINAVFKKQLLVNLKSDWETGGKTYPQGSLISIDFDAFLGGSRDFHLLIKPDDRSTIAGASRTRNHLLVNMLTNVRNELYCYTFEDGRWDKQKVPTPQLGSLGVVSTSEVDDQYYFTYTGFLKPTTLYYVNDAQEINKVKSLPEFFNGEQFAVSQHEATSADGTKIPYFMVADKKLQLNGKNPTLLYGYGGFEVSLRPSYSATVGMDWLEQGGVYVVANIRGGGEFGPKWHQAALKNKRHNAFNDFIAVAEDLVQRQVTSPRHLGIRGGSNGGLLVGTVFTMRPDLFNAVVCAVPLLDMQRFHKLLAGASWMAEYGNPDDPEEWRYISSYSPYHNLNADKKYPKVLFTTSTRDDRVHPGHARKMVAKMLDMGKPVFYYENTEGGHAGASNNRQSAFVNALSYSYLLMQLKDS